MEVCEPLIGSELYLRRLGTTGTVIAADRDRFGTAYVWTRQPNTVPVRHDSRPRDASGRPIL